MRALAVCIALALCAGVAMVVIAGCDDGTADGDTVPASSPDFRAQVRHVSARGLSIAHYERGTGRPLVMIMGTGSTMAEWDPALLRRLSRNHRLILFDNRGLGRTRGPLRAPFTFASLADDTAAMLRALKIGCADVLGWSMGGFIAQQLALRHRDLVRGVVLAGTNAGGDAAVLGPRWAQELDSDPNLTDDEALELLYPRTAAGRAAGHAFLRRLERSADTGEIPDDFDVPDRTVDAQVAAEDPWLRSNANYDGLATLRRGSVLAAGGLVDPSVPPANLRNIGRRAPGAQLALYREAAHAFLYQYSGPFAQRVDRFLAAQPAGCR